MLHHVISHGLVDQVGKSFNIADEFMIHVFKAHVIAVLPLTKYPIHACSHEWLKLTAKEIVELKIMPPFLSNSAQFTSSLVPRLVR